MIMGAVYNAMMNEFFLLKGDKEHSSTIKNFA